MRRTIAEHFRLYNEEFGRITRRAARNFLAEDWHAAQLDAVARIELYEQQSGALRRGSSAASCRQRRTDVALWVDIKLAFETLVARRPDSDFYHTFFNSVTRDLFGTVGVNQRSRVLRHQRGPRLRFGADPRLSGGRILADRGARDSRRPAVRRRHRRHRIRRASHQRRDRPIFRNRAGTAARPNPSN